MQFSVKAMLAMTAVVGLALAAASSGGWLSQVLTLLACAHLTLGAGLLGVSFPRAPQALDAEPPTQRLGLAFLGCVLLTVGLMLGAKGLGDSFRALLVPPTVF